VFITEKSIKKRINDRDEIARAIPVEQLRKISSKRDDYAKPLRLKKSKPLQMAIQAKPKTTASFVRE